MMAKEEVKHMPIVVRPEDIRLPKRKLKKDILYRLGIEEGKQIGLEEGFFKSIAGYSVDPYMGQD